MVDKYNIPYKSFQNGDDIEPAQFNSDFVYVEDALNEIDTNLADYVPLAGGTMTGNLAMGSHKITGVADGLTTNDAVNVNQLSTKLNLTGGTMSGALSMGGSKITNVANGSSATDVAAYGQLILDALRTIGGTMSGNIAMGSNKITGLANATASGDAVHLGQFAYNLGSNSGYINLPNGLQIRYGLATSSSAGLLTFSQAFSNSCLFVMVAPSINSSSGLTYAGVYSDTYTTSTCKVYLNSTNYKYFAVGI